MHAAKNELGSLAVGLSLLFTFSFSPAATLGRPSHELNVIVLIISS